MRELLRQFRVLFARQPAVVVGDLRAGSPAAGVAEERQVLPRRESGSSIENREQAELDEVIAAPARAELRPGAILHARGHTRHPPVGVHDVVVPARLERGAHAEARLTLDRLRQTILIGRERADRQVENRELHPARDVDADGVRDHGVPGRQHAADGEPVADVRIRHQGAGHRYGQLARILELLDRCRLEVVAPDPVRRIDASRNKRPLRRGLLDEQPRQLPVARIVDKIGRCRGDQVQFAHDGRHAALGCPGLLQNPLGRLGGAARRDADPDQVSCLHLYASVRRTAPAHLGERTGDVGLRRVESQRLAEGGGGSRSIPDGETRQAQPVQHHRGRGAGLERSLEVG